MQFYNAETYSKPGCSQFGFRTIPKLSFFFSCIPHAYYACEESLVLSHCAADSPPNSGGVACRERNSTSRCVSTPNEYSSTFLEIKCSYL